MKRCEKCRAMIPDKAIFCPECGAKNQEIKSLKKSHKKSFVIILCLIGIIAGTVFAVNKFMLSNNEQNGVKNKQTVLYDHYIYYIDDGTLYQKEADGKFTNSIMKIPQERKDSTDTYKNLVIYNQRLYAIRQELSGDTREFYIVSMNLDGTEYKKEVTPPKFKNENGESYMGWMESFSIEDDKIYYTYTDYPVAFYSIYKHDIGSSKSVKTKYDREETPVLFGKYAYYIKDEYEQTEGEPIVIKRNLETQKETEALSAQETKGDRNSLGIGKGRIVLSAGSSIIWRTSDDDGGYDIYDATENSSLVYITNMDDEEIIYKADDIYYRLNLKDKNSERLFSETDIENEFGANVIGIDKVGDTLAFYGNFNGGETDTFLFFIKEEDGKDYESKIRQMIGRYQDLK